MIKKLSIVLALLAPLSAFCASDVLYVSDVVNHSKNKDTITLVGTLIKQLGHDEFVISDKTGEIKVDFNEKITSLPVLSTKIKLKATVKRKNMSEKPTLEVLEFELFTEPKTNLKLSSKDEGHSQPKKESQNLKNNKTQKTSKVS